MRGDALLILPSALGAGLCCGMPVDAWPDVRNGRLSRRYDLQLDFLEAVFGFNSEIEISRLVTCDTCTGSGVKPGTTASTCARCGGGGNVVQQVRTPLGTFNQVIIPDQIQSLLGFWRYLCTRKLE